MKPTLAVPSGSEARVVGVSQALGTDRAGWSGDPQDLYTAPWETSRLQEHDTHSKVTEYTALTTS